MALIDPAETNNRPEPLPLRILDEERQALLDQLVPAEVEPNFVFDGMGYVWVM